MSEYTRTDLAIEGINRGSNANESVGVSEKKHGEITLTETKVKSSNGKRKALYVTLSRADLWEVEGREFEQLTAIIALEMRKMSRLMTGKSITPDFKVMVAGLGNADITSDSIGPLAVKRLTVTRHLRKESPELYGALKSCEISAVCPGVLGQTGIETVELIKGAAKTSEPDLVVAIDALAARSCDRLAVTVQLSDAGINPGSGIGNMRKAINMENIGIPVIAVGVPTVVSSSTLVYDALERAGINEIGDELKGVLENGKNYFVTLKESDIIAERLSEIIAESIRKAYTCR